MVEDINIKEHIGVLIEGVIVNCYVCKERCILDIKVGTKYWLCPNCKKMNKCENLIKQILLDTVLDAKIEKKEKEEVEE